VSGWITAKTFIHLELMAARYYRDIADDCDYLHGDQDGQEIIDLGACNLSVAEGIGAQERFGRLELGAMPDTAAGLVVFAGYKATSTSTGDASTLIFSLRDPNTSTIEDLASIGFIKAASLAGRGALEINTYSGGSARSPVSMRIDHHRRIGIGVSSPAYTVDVEGDCNATDGYEGLSTWGEIAPGTAYHKGDAEVTGHWKGTVGTGTAPLQASTGAPLNRNLNADNLQGAGWPGAGTSSTGTATVSSRDPTEYTIASVTAPSSGLWEITGEATLAPASGDLGAKFYVKTTGGDRWVDCSCGTASEKTQVMAVSEYQATNGETLYFKIKKTSGTGSSTATGSIRIHKVSP